MSDNKRKSIDCRDLPNDIGCTLTISGETKEVLQTAVRHAVEEHGHKDTPELRKLLKKLLKEETNTNKTIIKIKNLKTNPLDRRKEKSK